MSLENKINSINNMTKERYTNYKKYNSSVDRLRIMQKSINDDLSLDNLIYELMYYNLFLSVIISYEKKDYKVLTLKV